MPGKPENRESVKGMYHAKKGAGSGTVSSIEVGSTKGDGGIRFKLQGGILDHSRVKETIGRK